VPGVGWIVEEVDCATTRVEVFAVSQAERFLKKLLEKIRRWGDVPAKTERFQSRTAIFGIILGFNPAMFVASN
jgi:hypothetical protein